MADAVFTDKLRRTASIFHIEAHSAGWQGVAEASLAAGGAFKNRIKALGFFHRLQPTHAVFIRPLRGNGLAVQETYLRSEESRVGNGCVLTCSTRWSPDT